MHGPSTVSQGLRFRRFYTRSGADPYASVSWETREGVEVPAFWSETAARIVAAKYLRRPPGAARENGVRPMVARVVGTIAGWGRQGGYWVLLASIPSRRGSAEI